VLQCVAVRCSVFVHSDFLCFLVCIAQPEPRESFQVGQKPSHLCCIILCSLCCSVLKCVAVCFSVLQCVARPEPRKRCELGQKAIAPVLQCVVCIVLQCVAVCCVHCVAMCCSELNVCCSVLNVCCSVLNVCCSVLQGVAVCEV